MATAALPVTTLKPSRGQIDEFLQQKRIAFVGVSRNPADFSRKLFDAFRKRGYDVIPVNPNASEIAGQASFTSVREIPAISAAILMTSPKASEAVVTECIKAGVMHIWIYSAASGGAVTQGTVEDCLERGINVIAGECPFMFFAETGFPHRLHGLIKKIFGTYPA